MVRQDRILQCTTSWEVMSLAANLCNIGVGLMLASGKKCTPVLPLHHNEATWRNYVKHLTLTPIFFSLPLEILIFSSKYFKIFVLQCTTTNKCTIFLFMKLYFNFTVKAHNVSCIIQNVMLINSILITYNLGWLKNLLIAASVYSYHLWYVCIFFSLLL